MQPIGSNRQPGLERWPGALDQGAARIRDRRHRRRAVLEQVCGAADRIETIKQAIAADGPVIRSRAGVRAHPALQAELQNRALVIRGLEKLGLNLEPIKPHGHPTKPTGWIPPDLR
jgi:hypothetical protein